MTAPHKDISTPTTLPFTDSSVPFYPNPTQPPFSDKDLVTLVSRMDKEQAKCLESR